MHEIIIVNWPFILSVSTFLAGFALLVSYLSFYRTISLVSSKIGVYICIAGVVMVLAGTSAGLLIVESTELARMKVVAPVPEVAVLDKGTHNHLLKNLNVINGNYRKSRITMFVNGEIETPLYSFNSSNVVVSFLARGSFCKGEHTILKIVYEELNRENIFEIRLKKFIELSSSMSEYSLQIYPDLNKKGRIKILFVNDDYDVQKKQDRNLWFSDLTLLVK